MIKHIDKSKLVWLSATVIMLWCAIPLLIMLLNLINVNPLVVYTIWINAVYIIGAVGICIAILYCYKEKDIFASISINKLLYSFLPLVLLLLFLLWCLICCSLAEDKFMAFYGRAPMMDSFFTYFLYAGFLLSGLIVANDRKLVKMIAKFFLLVSTLMAGITILDNSFTEKVNVNDFYTNTFHYQSVFYNTNHYGYYLVIVILVAYFLYENESNKLKEGLYVLCGALNIELLIFNNSLGSYLAVLLTLIFVIVWKFINSENQKNKAISFFLVFLLISALSIFYSNNLLVSFVGMFGDVSLLIGSVSDDSLNIDMVGSSRGLLWKNALENIKLSPFWGYGLENVGKIVIDETSPLNHPHNVFLQIALFTGIPGLLIYFSTYVVGVIRLLQNRKQLSKHVEAVAFVVVGYLISLFFGVPKFYTSPYFIVVLGVCMSECLADIDKKAAECH